VKRTCARFRRKSASLEAEILVFRHQLNQLFYDIFNSLN